MTVSFAFKTTDIDIGNRIFVDSLLGNIDGKITVKVITFYKTYSGLGLLISKAHACGHYVSIANDNSISLPKPDLKFPSSKSNCTELNKWHVISVTRSNKEESLNNCWSNGEKLLTFTTENFEGYDHCYIGNLGRAPVWYKTQLTGCIGEIIGLYRTLKDEEILYIHI